MYIHTYIITQWQMALYSVQICAVFQYLSYTHLSVLDISLYDDCFHTLKVKHVV